MYVLAAASEPIIQALTTGPLLGVAGSTTTGILGECSSSKAAKIAGEVLQIATTIFLSITLLPTPVGLSVAAAFALSYAISKAAQESNRKALNVPGQMANEITLTVSKIVNIGFCAVTLGMALLSGIGRGIGQGIYEVAVYGAHPC